MPLCSSVRLWTAVELALGARYVHVAMRGNSLQARAVQVTSPR